MLGVGKVGIAHWCSQKNTKGKKICCYSLRQVGVGLPYHSAHHLLTDGLVVKPNMLREQKSRDRSKSTGIHTLPNIYSAGWNSTTRLLRNRAQVGTDEGMCYTTILPKWQLTFLVHFFTVDKVSGNSYGITLLSKLLCKKLTHSFSMIIYERHTKIMC